VECWRGLTSASESFAASSAYLGKEGGTLFLIEAETARKISNFSKYDEEEYIFLPNTPFKIEEVEQNDNITLVHVVEIIELLHP